jgi:biotin carboxyl carrier protein
VKLDSASTFECIVDGPRHYFMEVNTRIQVEHRVSELCYALRFENPSDPSDSFDVHSLVECMALLAKHKERLPRPKRVLRDLAAVEARLNATDRSLSPHAGGEVLSWSDPIPGEIRDDQGISAKNPDTGLFMRYRLAGAYDSNIALLVTTGDSRRDSYERLAEILRCTTLRGPDLCTNLEFHYGLVHYFLSHGVMAKPTTRFVVPYLTLVGLLHEESGRIDLDYAYQQVVKAALAAVPAGDEAAKKATREILALKETLLTRPLRRLFEEPHHLSAWLSRHRLDFEIEGERVKWRKNPAEILADTYHLLHMNAQPDAPAAHVIWDQDRELLERTLGFYAKLERLAGRAMPFHELDARLRGPAPAFGLDAEALREVRAAHHGFQLGLSLLALLPRIAQKVGFYDLRLEDDLTVRIPERLLDPKLQARMKKVLVPPPAMKSDEIVAASGGMFYAQEAPHLPAFIAEGAHFKVGDPLYIIEVMKMFNKVYAPFAGTVDKILVNTGEGTIVTKGQPLFKVTPDEQIVEEDPVEKLREVRENTQAHLAQIL